MLITKAFVSSAAATLGAALLTVTAGAASVAESGPQYRTVPNQYIIRFSDDMSRSEVLSLTKELMSRHQLRLRHTYKSSIRGFSAVFPAGQLESVRAYPAVLSVEENGYWYLHTLDAPSDLTAVAVSTSQIDLTWTDNATTEGGFHVARSTTGPSGSFSIVGRLRGANRTSFSDTGLAEGTEYCYQVRALANPRDAGPYSEPACATPGGGEPPPPPPPPPPVEPPAAPSGLDASAVNDQRIDLSWVDESDNESGFNVERALGAGGAFTEIDIVGIDVTTYQDTGLSAESEYCYRVRAFNDQGDSDYTAEVCATTEAEPPVGACNDSGNHDSLAGLWNISQVKADLNPSWQSSQLAGCELEPWFFGIDTGVDSDHPDLNVAEIMGFLASDPGNSGEDDHGHGSHTAGSAAAIDGNGGVVGVAPGARVYGFKVCDAGGSCALDDIVAGVDEVTARKLANPGQPMVANMSLGGGISTSNDQAVRRSVNAGVVYSLSAGNGVFGACFFPANSQNSSPARTGDDAINASDGSDGDFARINGVITVTSSNVNDADVNCNFGNPVTVAAPGDGILSTWLSGGTATISGTSMAAPHVAGAAILYLHRNPDATPAEVEQAIVNELDPWTTNESPSADGRLDVETL